MNKKRMVQIEDYEPLVGAETIERIIQKAKPLHDLHVANINLNPWSKWGDSPYKSYLGHATLEGVKAC